MSASEKKSNQPVNILPPIDPREFEEVEPDEGLLGIDDLFETDLPAEKDEGASE